MFRPLKCSLSKRRPHRRGTSFILIVVVMLSLFSAVGTAYALFAMREAKLAMMRKDEQGGGSSAPLKAPDPTDTINQFFSALIYDRGNESFADLTNGLRGHSIGRSMYGYDVQNPYNTTPWNGLGIFNETNAAGNRASQVNYTLMTFGGNRFLLDPEYMGVRTFDGAGNPVPFDPTNPANHRTYVAKNAGYSYPDLKDFFLAAYDPATGEVLVPSFHREWLFGSLAPTNTKWTTDETGKLLTLRPRPQEHPRFPRVGPDPDGIYRGDVQNLPGGVGMQKNDSIWIDLGLPVITLPGNRKVKPLVAVLVLPLNGYLDANSHGNNYYNGAHSSYHGLLPSDVNLGAVIPPAEALTVVAARGTPQSRFMTTTTPTPPVTRRFDPFSNGPLPVYAPIAWNGTLVPMPAYPTGNNLSGLPSFDLTKFQTANAPELNHPSLHNPSEWSNTTSPNRIFPTSDIKRLQLPYAGTPDWYSQSDVAAFSQSGLKGNQGGFNLVPVQATLNAYRLDQSHYTRGLVGTRSFTLDRPKVTPSFVSGSLQLTTVDPNAPFYSKPAQAALTTYPTPQTPGPGGDFASATRWTNALAALGSVDLNRPLADYRVTATANQPLGQGNIGNRVQADADRQQLARDIFIRLAASTGGAITDINPAAIPPIFPYTIPATVTTGTPQYDALRYLAQLAVNIVDYIDNDDISTRFQWHPTITTEVVYGVEKPRLVINEVHTQIANDPEDKTEDPDGMGVKQALGANAQAHVRFWLELLNPTSAPPVGNPVGPLGTGGVSLSAYRIEIARASRSSTPANPYWRNPANATGSFDQSVVPDIVYTPSGNTANKIVQPNNNPANGPATTYNPAGAANNGIFLLGPSLDQSKVKTVPGTNPAVPYEFNPQGLAAAPWTDADGFVTTTAPTASPNSNNLVYTLQMPQATNLATDFKRHVVFLRRLANPYATHDATTNPYITVDMMDYVPSFDGVARAASQTDARTARAANAAPSATTFDPIAERFSVGKVQPYAGHSVADTSGTYNSYQFTNATTPAVSSMVLDQKTTADNQPKHTFGRHNGLNATQPGGTTVNVGAAGTPPTLTPVNETLMLPYDWLVHMDRPLVNQLELLQVRDTPPHLVTDYFIRQQGTALNYEGGYVQWLENGFARAFEYLSVRSHVAGVPHGGRVPGRINVNAIQDQRIMAALLDPQLDSNGLNSNGFDSTFVNNTAWGQWILTRGTMQPRTFADTVTTKQTPVPNSMPNAGTPPYLPAPSKTDDPVNGVDRPFLPLGAPITGVIATPDSSAFAFGGGSNIEQTILRRTTVTDNPIPQPYLFMNRANKPTTLTYPTTQPDGPSYIRAEPVRKMMNNITTVNHQYIVFATIGYFDADIVNQVQIAPGVSIPQLGPEAFISIPGDMRQKFVAVIDMSNMALGPIPPAAADPDQNRHSTEPPFFTSLETTAYNPPPGTATTARLTITAPIQVSSAGKFYTVGSEGQDVEISDGATGTPVSPATVLVIGYGAEKQVVQVVAGGINATTREIDVQTVSGTPFRTAWGGTCVSNVRPGFAGPQPDFNYNDPKYKSVIPYIERLK